MTERHQHQHTNPRLAVLIDADNAQAAVVQPLFAEVSRYGIATVKRIYGDWTTPNLKGWKECLNVNAVQPIQQFGYTTGKNSTDAALIIDAMDLLHSGQVDGFCLVSSDSDFTRLATRIRESGRMVYGFGEQKTPKPFVAACDKFIYTEILRPAREARSPRPPRAELDSDVRAMLRGAVIAAAREDGWSNLSTVGSLLTKTNPDFDARNFGFEKLGELMRAQAFLDVKSTSAPGATHGPLMVRLKESAAA